MFGICAVYVQYLSSHSLNIYWTYTGEVLDIYWTTIEGKLWVHLGYVMGISKRYMYCIESPMGKRHGIFPFRHDGMQICRKGTGKFRKAYAKIIKAFARKLAVCSQKLIACSQKLIACSQKIIACNFAHAINKSVLPRH